MNEELAPISTVEIHVCAEPDLPDWANLRMELWPDGTIEEHTSFGRRALAEPARLVAFIARDDDGTPLGFAEASLRNDYVNGCSTSPVGFLEGLYVRALARRSGIARGLVTAIERWAIDRDCSELASDAVLENDASQETHRRIGFTETERVVYFVKRLDDTAAE